MYIINLTYTKSTDIVDKVLPRHINFLNKYYKANKFICSGRKNPRSGGIILCNSNNLDEVKWIISEDPFNIEKVANYEIIEFQPTKYADEFKAFI